MRLAISGIVAVLSLAAAASAVPVAVPSTVTCESIIDPGGSYTWRPERVVLGAVAAPPSYLPQTMPNGDARWPFWSKAGLVVRADSPPVRVSVPSRWRERAAIAWGNAAATSALRFESCPPSSSLGDWNPYSGGFVLRSRSACVPLAFRVGARTATIRFGVGRHCR